MGIATRSSTCRDPSRTACVRAGPLAIRALAVLVLPGGFLASPIHGQGEPKKVFCDYFVGLRTRRVSASSSLPASGSPAQVWQLLASPNSDPDCDFFSQINWSGDAYVTSDKKEISGAFYPLIGPYDTSDPDLQEYHCLLAIVAGIDGFFGEWQWTQVPQFTEACVHSPNPQPSPQFSTRTLEQLATYTSSLEASAGIDFSVGIHWSTGTFVDWYDRFVFDTSAPESQACLDRSVYTTQAGWDLQYVLDNVYLINGIELDGRPLVLFFDVNTTDTATACLSLGKTCTWFDESDIVAIRSAITGHDPILLGSGRPNHHLGGEGSGLVEAALADEPGELDGFHCWHRTTNHEVGFDPCLPGVQVCSLSAPTTPPWTDINTVTDELDFLGRFLDGEGADPGVLALEAATSEPAIDYFVPSTVPRFDNHKGLSWGTGFKNYIPKSDGGGPTLRQLIDAWPANASCGFITTFNDVQEGTGIEPTREFGYNDLELCAEEIAEWKGVAAPDPLLFPMPRRLYDLRKGLELVQTTIQRSGAPAPSALAAAMLSAYTQADAAAIHIAAGDTTLADAALASAEQDLGDATGMLGVTRIDEFWEVREDPSGGAPIDVISPGLVASTNSGIHTHSVKSGRLLNTPADFDIVGASFETGYFVGTISVEVFDTDDQVAEQAESLRISVAAAPGKTTVLDYRVRESDTWRQIQCDLINATFADPRDGSGQPLDTPRNDIRVQQPQSPSSLGVRALHSVRIEGYLYEVQ